MVGLPLPMERVPGGDLPGSPLPNPPFLPAPFTLRVGKLRHGCCSPRCAGLAGGCFGCTNLVGQGANPFLRGVQESGVPPELAAPHPAALGVCRKSWGSPITQLLGGRKGDCNLLLWVSRSLAGAALNLRPLPINYIHELIAKQEGLRQPSWPCPLELQ